MPADNTDRGDLINHVCGQLDAYGLYARLLHIQPVKSYAPRVNHVMFNIKVEPKQSGNSLGCGLSSTNGPRLVTAESETQIEATRQLRLYFKSFYYYYK
jgi:hypothetical protein